MRNYTSESGDLSGLSDRQLVELLRNDGISGNEAALTQLFSRYIRFICRKAREISVGSIDADDLAQEGLMALFACIKGYQFDLQKDFSSYAMKAIVNSMLRAVSKENAIIERHAQLPEEENDFPSNDSENPEQIVLSKEVFDLISEKGFASLSKFEQQVLFLHLEGYSYPLIAEKLCTSRKSVDNALQRVRRKLKNIYQESEEG